MPQGRKEPAMTVKPRRVHVGLRLCKECAHLEPAKIPAADAVGYLWCPVRERHVDPDRPRLCRIFEKKGSP